MAKVTILPGFSQVNSWEGLRRFTSMIVEAIIAQLNGNLTLKDNLSTSGPHSVTFSSSTDVQTVPHTLARIPEGFLVVNLSSGVVVYKPAAPEWLADKIFLQSSGAGTALIYVLG